MLENVVVIVIIVVSSLFVGHRFRRQLKNGAAGCGCNGGGCTGGKCGDPAEIQCQPKR